MIPSKKTVASAPNISATMKIIIPFIIFPAYTVPIPGKNREIIKAKIGFAKLSPPIKFMINIIMICQTIICFHFMVTIYNLIN